jgi:hypothetical protein
MVYTMALFEGPTLKATLVRLEEKLDKLILQQEKEVASLREDLLAAASPQAYALRHRGDGKVTTDMVAQTLRTPRAPNTPSAIRRAEYHPPVEES